MLLAEIVKAMSDEEFVVFRNLEDDWYEGRINKDELEQVLTKKYGITFAEYFEYFEAYGLTNSTLCVIIIIEIRKEENINEKFYHRYIINRCILYYFIL